MERLLSAPVHYRSPGMTRPWPDADDITFDEAFYAQFMLNLMEFRTEDRLTEDDAVNMHRLWYRWRSHKTKAPASLISVN